MKVAPGQDVAAAAQQWRTRPGVLSATANYVAHLSAWEPGDPGPAGVPAGWQQMQWNFLAETGINAPQAWSHLQAVGRPGGKGVTVAVLDTGVAYSDRDRFRRSPDFAPHRFTRGWDFVGEDPYPNDDNGHGTHVASTIAENTGNGIGLTGIAYGVRLMPIKVLDRTGEGDSGRIARGIRWAADHGAQIINLSFEFPSDITRDQIPNILDALRYARRKGVLVVGASGNAAAAAVAYPARSASVFSVGATTQHGCQADYSNEGMDLDIVAPGGGVDAALEGDPACRPLDDRRARHLPGHVQRLGPPVRHPERLHRHLDGGAARVRDGRARDRVRRARPEPDPGRDRAPVAADRARPRPAGQGPALRLGPAGRRPRDRSGDPRYVVRMIRTEQGA